MKIVGITGGIASGKTLVTDYLKLKGYKVYLADDISHKIINTIAKDKIVTEFSEEVLNVSGNVDRHHLANIVFNDSKKLEELNNIVHPLVREAIIRIIDSSASERQDIIFFEVPLLYESHMEDLFNYVINIYTSQKNQIERICSRDFRSEKEARNIISSQMSNDDKNKLANYTIDNSSGIVELFKRIDEVLEKIKLEAN